MPQLTFFDCRDPLHPASKSGIAVEEISLGLDDATFVGGLDQRIHRWYKLRPSFSPKLVHYLVDRFNGGERRTVLDPFAGAATSPIEAALLGRPAVGVEINPFLVAYAQRALDWSASADVVQTACRKATALLRKAFGIAERFGLDGVRKEFGVEPPPIHNVFRWWRKDVLAYLLAAKATMLKQDDSVEARLIWLSLGTICIEVANIKRLHPTLTFYDRSGEHIDAAGDLLRKLAAVAEDLAFTATLPEPEAEIVEGNSRSVDAVLGGRRFLANVITSPPYCNRYSYVWETRPHLYMMDLATTAAETTRLDVEGIGGTWGKATSNLIKGEIAPATSLLAEALAPVLGPLRPVDNLMANYAVKYFNNMDEHFDSLGKVLEPGSNFAYVVGNSRLKEVDVPTEAILASMLQSKDWAHVDYLLVFRRRIGRRSLYETAIVGHVP
jgi:hypothetical protein